MANKSDRSALDIALESMNNYLARDARMGDDLSSIGHVIFNKVGDFLSHTNLSHDVEDGEYTINVANEALSSSVAFNDISADSVVNLCRNCGIKDSRLGACARSVMTIIDRCIGKKPASAWAAQNRTMDRVNNGLGEARSLESLYTADMINSMLDAKPGLESMGVNIDMAVPDMKVSITVAIMNFHDRLIPRLIPTRTTTQPMAQYTRETLEVYDLTTVDGPRKQLVELYADPTIVANELKRIIPLKMNDPENQYLVDDGIIKFGVTANILKLSEDSSKYGYGNLNRTDIIAENVKFDSFIIKVVSGGVTELYSFKVPTDKARLTRIINGPDVANRNADIFLTVALTSASVPLNGVGDDAYESSEGASTIFAKMPQTEQVVLRCRIKPTISLKNGECNALMSIDNMFARNQIEGAPLSDEEGGAKAIIEGGLEIQAFGYSLDARFSEENLRKTSIAMWTARQPFSYDIPIGRNYVSDYLIGQTNAEENATNLTKLMGIGQDGTQLKLLADTLPEIYERLRLQGTNTDQTLEDVGASFVSGAKIRPSVWIGEVDFSKIETIRESDRPGDIKQHLISYLTAATSRLMQDSFWLQQLGGGTTATFKCVTVNEIIGTIINAPHIHNHMNKEDERDLGDGIEYVMVLPNGIRIEFVTTTFEFMLNRLILIPTIKNNAESELHYAHNWDYGSMVAHYTPSGEAAHHRMFANIRQLAIVTTPLGMELGFKGMDLANGISDEGVILPTFNTVVTGGLTVLNSPAAPEP